MTWTEAKAEAQRLANQYAEPVFVIVDPSAWPRRVYDCMLPTATRFIQPPVWTAFPE